MRLLLKGVQHVDGICEGCNIDDPAGTQIVSDTYLPHTRPDVGHRFSIVWIETTLHPIERIAGFTTRTLRKVTQLIQRAADDRKRLHLDLYQNRYISAIFRYRSAVNSPFISSAVVDQDGTSRHPPFSNPV